MKNTASKIALATLLTGVALSSPLQAADYVIDTQGAHASINFKIKHLGYSWVTGRFDKFSGNLSFDDKNPSASKVSVIIDTTSVNTNQADRDKHLRSGDFLNVKKFPTAKFVSTSVDVTGKRTGVIHGKLTLHGVTRDIAIVANLVGSGKDPWGGYRAGFSGKTSLALKDYGIKYNLGPASREVELSLEIEGIRK